ncbi:MAG: hypothetical protein R2865_00805 [Deinococcales bacterium]
MTRLKLCLRYQGYFERNRDLVATEIGLTAVPPDQPEKLKKRFQGNKGGPRKPYQGGGNYGGGNYGGNRGGSGGNYGGNRSGDRSSDRNDRDRGGSGGQRPIANVINTESINRLTN